jgi:group I intron endonuclease
MIDNVIYAYRKKSNNKIVYVGQTENLKERHKRHIQYDPFDISLKEYNYPLSRGIRKYGEDEYELIILERNLLKEELNDKEKYWIAYYNTYYDGYNQTTGGANPIRPVFTEDKIDIVIEMLKDESYSYNDIMNKTGISMTHIYNINTGKRRKRDNLIYPIRSSNMKGTKGLRFSQEECKKIHEEILKNDKTFIEISKQFNCSSSTIMDINRGKTKAYRLKGYIYPLRTKSRSISKRVYWKNK